MLKTVPFFAACLKTECPELLTVAVKGSYLGAGDMKYFTVYGRGYTMRKGKKVSGRFVILPGS
jgi:hypothetical protein